MNFEKCPNFALGKPDVMGEKDFRCQVSITKLVKISRILGKKNLCRLVQCAKFIEIRYQLNYIARGDVLILVFTISIYTIIVDKA